jgi:hypothetical protein
MKRSVILWGALLAVTSILSSCKKDDPKIPDAEAILYNGAAVHSGDSIRVKYGEPIDLNTLFTLNPANAKGQLTYSLTEQPAYSDVTTNNEVKEIKAYSLEGSTLTSIARVPDELPGTGPRSRTVLQGELKIVLTGGADLNAIEVVLVQTDKPALEAPVITFSAAANNDTRLTNTADGNKLMTLSTSSQPTRFSSENFFTVTPIDYDPVNILLRPGTNPASTYIRMSAAGALEVGGGFETEDHGQGQYMVAFYSAKRDTLTETNEVYQARVAAAFAAAEATGKHRIYVDVNYVAPTTVVGIIANTDAIGKTGKASFWRNNANGRQVPQTFILAKLNDGNTRVYDPTTDGVVMAGKFDQYLEGRTTEYETGWWSHVALKAAFGNNLDVDCPVGTDLSFTITHKDHIEEEGWTVKVETKRMAANPETVQ